MLVAAAALVIGLVDAVGVVMLVVDWLSAPTTTLIGTSKANNDSLIVDILSFDIMVDCRKRVYMPTRD